MTTITKPSFAKVNLFLDIQRLRDDGYHDLCMVNAKISLHDTITCTFNDSNKIALTSNLDDIPLDGKNTAYKAADLFLEKSGLQYGIEIHLEKNIPHGAGLGGGSSNAAVVLETLNELTNQPLSLESLCEIGVSIGADVPFFLYGRACQIYGIGESIKELDYEQPTKSPFVVLVSPAVHVPTGKAYGLWDASDSPLHMGVEQVVECIQQQSFDRLHSHLFNSFEPVIYDAFPQIGQVYQDFCEVCSTKPLLSGSGSNLFALVNEEYEAERVMAVLSKRGYTAQVCQLIL